MREIIEADMDTRNKEGQKLIAAGYICGILALFIFPIGFGLAGVVIGIINLTKGRVGHGIAQIVIAATLGLLGVWWGMVAWASSGLP